MRCPLEKLAELLRKPPAAAWLVSGDEALLVGEAADAIRAAARAAGYSDRQMFFVERGFDWDSVRSAAQSLSLFSERRILELRMPTGKPDRGAEYLSELILRPPPDTLLLIITGHLDKKTADAAWARALDKQGVWVDIPDVKIAALPDWLCRRAAGAGLTLEAEAAQVIAARAEGNLLAAAQEIDKLALLADGGRLTLESVRAWVGASARYDVYALADAASRGNAQRALQVLEGLKAEGTEPTLILWALGREIRGLWQARERDRLRTSGGGSGWNMASPVNPVSMQRARRLPLAQLLREAGNADRIIKGQMRGDVWTSLRALTAGLAGALHHRLLSGRVAS
jgi:DNA polymerase III subunit delta